MTIYLLQPDGVALSAGAHRRGRAALNGGGANRAVGGRSGFRVDTASDILTVSTTAWSLKACSAMIDPGASVNQGMYGWASDSVITGTPTPPDATLPRKDIYYIQVNDSSAGDGTSGTPNANVYYLAGTPAASPNAPALPARSFLIATVTVPQSGGGSPSVVLNPARFAAAGAPLPVYSQAEMDALDLFDGLIVQRRDLAGRPQFTRTSSGWVTPVEDISFTPETGYSFTGRLTKITGTTGSRAHLVGRVTRSSGGDGPALGAAWVRVMTTFLPASLVPVAGAPADTVANLISGLDGNGNPIINAHVNVAIKNDRSLWASLDAGNYTWPLGGYLSVDLSWPL